MKKLHTLLLTPLLALSLSGGACIESLAGAGAQGIGLPPSPQAAANRTQLDETLLNAVEFGYKAARIAVEIMVDARQCTGTCATRFRTLNRQAFAAVQAAEAAYDAGNAPGYLEALGRARALANQLLTLTGRNN